MKPIHFICLLLLFASCKNTERSLTKITAKNIPIDSTLVASTKIESFIAPYKEKLIGEMESVLTYTAKDLTKESILHPVVDSPLQYLRTCQVIKPNRQTELSIFFFST